MAKYLTPAVARAVGTGLPLEAFSDADLAGMIAQAEADIDGFMGFADDNGLGFAPGTREERHAWQATRRRVYPRSFPVPVRSVSRFEIVVSQGTADGQYIAAVVPPNEVVVVNDLGYMEPISLSVIAYSLTPVIAQLSLVRAFAHVVYEAGYRFPKAVRLFSGDQLLYHSFVPAWDRTQPMAVTVDGTPVATGVTLLPDDGAVLFDTPRSPGAVVVATFAASLPDPVVEAARMAFVEVAQDAVANRQGMAGFDLAKRGAWSAQRYGTGRRYAAPTIWGPPWWRLLAPFKAKTGGIALA